MNKEQLRVGDRIRIIGDHSDFTDHLDDQILTIVDMADDVPDSIIAKDDGDREWYIWIRNIMEVME